MRFTRKITTGLLLGWMCQSSMAAQPPCIDRPTPPPCCADGQCFASPASFGYYDTRWRRWPLEQVARASTAKAPALSAPMQQDVVPFVTPPPEQEDRKAPPPSVPTGEQSTANGPSAPGRTPAGPGGATQPTGTQPPAGGTGFPAPPPPSAPTTSPAQPSTQPSTTPLYKSVPSDSPLNRGGTTPMGDADPPPSLPFGPTLTVPAQSPRGVSQQPAASPVQLPTVRPVQAPSSDPPPAPPIALVSYEE